MSSFIRFCQPALLSLLCLIGSLSYAADKPLILTLVADPYCPYNCALDAKQQGYVIDLAKLIFEPEGYQVQYFIVPWSRAIKEVRSGRFSAAIGVSQDSGRGLILPKEPIGIVHTGFIVYRDSGWNYQNRQSLQQITLGVVADYDYGSLNSYLKAPENQSRVQLLKGDKPVERNLRMLEKNRIDAYLEDFNVGFYMAGMLGFKNLFRRAGLLEEPLPIYLGISPKLANGQELSDIYDKGIQRLRRSGQLSSVLHRYALTDWQTF